MSTLLLLRFRKIKAKEDEHQLKLLKEQYLDFDGEDDGRRIKLSKSNTTSDRLTARKRLFFIFS